MNHHREERTVFDMERPKKYEPDGGFSIVRIVLSDALPTAAFDPDFEDRVQEELARKKWKQELEEWL